MDSIFDIYAQLVCTGQLRLRVSDVLSINSEESTYDFALLLARKACNMTKLTVNIVVTKNGKVIEEVPMEPEIIDIYKPHPGTPVMCRILDLDEYKYYNNDDISKVSNNLIEINKFGNLSDPLVLNRRISVPWTTVIMPSFSFAQALLEEAEEGDQHRLLEVLYRLDQEDPEVYWHNQSTLISFRKNLLNSLGDGIIKLENGSSNFMAKILNKSNWAGGITKLRDNREFYHKLPSQNLHTTLDNKSGVGIISASRNFHLFGKIVKNASFTIDNGRVTDFSASEGYDALNVFFESDINANIVSGIALSDEDSIESQYLSINTHPFFAMENCTSIIFGGINIDTLDALFYNSDLEDLNVEESLIQLVVPIGNKETIISINGQIIIEEGNFIN
ncbi:MAG: aminopeptidase [Spirochaetaceae bacterium]|nr:aminopeptidase [Spirochaetaceae bacterium]